ncbi:MAG: hypothetical protein ACRD16_09395 [Thermoanaerobaculia bacterium]
MRRARRASGSRQFFWMAAAFLGLYLTRRQARVLARAVSLYVIGRALRALSEALREEYSYL